MAATAMANMKDTTKSVCAFVSNDTEKMQYAMLLCVVATFLKTEETNSEWIIVRRMVINLSHFYPP